MPTASALLSRLVPWRRPVDHKCVLLGAGGSGKTTLLYKLKLGEVVTTIPTIGFNCELVECIDKAVTFWDFGGCDKIAPLARHLLDSETGVLFVVDATMEEQFFRDFTFGLLDLHAGQLVDAGGQYFWVVLAKQDLLPLETRDETVGKLKDECESRLRGFPQLKSKVFSQPGLSLLEDDFVWPIFVEIYAGLEQQRRQQGKKERPAAVPTIEIPKEEQLRARIRSEGLNDISADEFWRQLTAAQLPAWNHRNHLRAGYMIYLDVLSKMGSLWDAVEEFLRQLEQLRNSNPQRFTNTQHRTMTILWLHYIRIAILRYRDDVNDGVLSSADDFQLVLLHTPALMNSRIWEPHYTKSLLFSPKAKENFCLPDLAPLPDYHPKASISDGHTPILSPNEPKDTIRNLGLSHLAFTVVQQYTTTQKRRGLIIKEALQAQQSLTLRLRAINSSVPPYSETQSYFWIQITHAAVAGMPSLQPARSSAHLATAGEEKKPSIASMTFETFALLFPDLTNVDLWKRYYTAKAWHSISARMAFVNPDIRPLPNVIGISDQTNILKAASNLLDKEVKSQVPSLKDESNTEDEKDWTLVEDTEEKSKADIELQKALILSEVNDILKSQEAQPVVNSQTMPGITSHAHLLYALFALFSGPSRTPTTAASKALSTFAGPQIRGFTQKAFWIQIFTAAFMQSRQDSQLDVKEGELANLMAFTELLDHHPRLMYEDLWMKYYSREVWESYDAREGLVETDRRKLDGFLGRRTG